MAQLKSSKVFGDLDVTGEVNVSTKVTVKGEEVWDTGNLLNIGTTAATARTALGLGAQATRWPTFAEVTGKPSTYAPSGHTHPISQVTGLDAALADKADKTTQVIAGTGLTGGGTLASNRTLNVSYGTAARTAAQGNDSRINNGQTAFGWGSHASAGYAKTKADVGLSGIPNTNDSTANFLRGDGTWVTPPNTTYSEISTAEIDAGTASTRRTISGRRMKYALDKKANTTTQVIAGTGLTGGGTLAANRTLNVSYGTAAGTAAQGNDSRLSNSREWTAGTVSQAEAEAGTATTRRAFTAQRVRQAIVAWFNGVSGAIGRTILGRDTAIQVRSDLGLGSAATYDVGESAGQLLEVGSNGYGIESSVVVTNWNEATKNGVFYMAQDAANAPEGGWFLGRYQGHNVGNGTQTVETFYDDHPKVFKRTLKDSAWGQWSELLNTVNIRQDTGTSTVYPMSQKAVTDRLSELQALGVGQTWQDVSSIRASGTTFTNTTGRTIGLFIAVQDGQTTDLVIYSVGALSLLRPDFSSGVDVDMFQITIPNGETYSVSAGANSIIAWWELR